MTVDQHRVADPPIPGGTRQEIIQGTVAVSGGSVTETVTLNLNYDNKPTVVASAGNGSTDEEVSATIQSDDPTSNDDIVIRVDSSTDEDKEYHVLVTSPISENS